MNKTTNTKENGCEKHIVDYLIDSNSYVERENTDYDNINCVDEYLLFQFLEDTQAKALEKLKRYHKDLYKQKIVKRLNDQIKQKGVIEVLRKGIVDGFTDTKLRLLYDKPVSHYNTEANDQYKANIFSAMRQVYFSPQNKKSLDIVTFINGLPIISFELRTNLPNKM